MIGQFHRYSQLLRREVLPLMSEDEIRFELLKRAAGVRFRCHLNHFVCATRHGPRATRHTV